MNDADPAGGEHVFRWQSLLQRTLDALFILDRRRRLVFANRAWEALAGLRAADVRGLTCRRPRPASAADCLEEILAHALTPPPEAGTGLARVRRLLPGEGARRRWWDVEFFPFRLTAEGGGFLLGRVTLVDGNGEATRALPERLVSLRERQVQRHGFDLFASRLPAMHRLAEQARLAARMAGPVLLLGETGTGKRTLARVIHYQGPHRDRALAAVDCAHLPAAALLEAIFGERTQGAVGTLYLAEPATLPRDQQLRLCEWLSGPGREARAPRLLAGCRGDPREDVRRGSLLEELRCALSPLIVEVPPVRERRDDLSALVNRLLARANEAGMPHVSALSPGARDLLHTYSWPGNLRELNAVLTAARLHAGGDIIDICDLPVSLRLAEGIATNPAPAADSVVALDEVLEQAERRLIEQALRKARGNKTRAAELLGIWRQRLVRRMAVLGIADVEETKSG